MCTRPDRRAEAIPKNAQLQMILAQLWPCCLNCNEWSEKQGLCWKFNQVPPPDVVVVGCVEWLGTVPF